MTELSHSTECIATERGSKRSRNVCGLCPTWDWDRRHEPIQPTTIPGDVWGLGTQVKCSKCAVVCCVSVPATPRTQWPHWPEFGETQPTRTPERCRWEINRRPCRHSNGAWKMKLTDTRSQTQRVMDKLRCSSPADGRRDIDRLAAQGGT